jgi:hypothetical protein
VLADGTKVVALTPHKSATFYLLPGYHELTMQAGEISPTASFKGVAGGEYYFQMDYEHVVSSTSLRDLKVSLSMQPNISGSEELREVSIDQSSLLEILSQKQSGWTGAERSNIDRRKQRPRAAPMTGHCSLIHGGRYI